MPPVAPTRLHVAVVAFDQISPFHLSAPCVVFGDSRLLAPHVQLQVCAGEPGPLRTTAGFALDVPLGLEALDQADVVIMPSWRDPQERPPEALLQALRAAHARGAQVLGLCLGAFVLAEAGLLEGRRATTHWAWAAEFARRYPQVQVDARVLYIDDGRVWTSAGTTASLDCCLHLLRQRLGSTLSNRVARLLVMPPHRQGGQAQFIEQPLPATTTDTRLAELLDWVLAHLDQPHSLDSLAAQALMSRRSLTRRFKQLTGGSVGEWLLGQRLARAQHWLETTDQRMEQIAQRCGLGSAQLLRHHFQAVYGVSPTAWRQSFRGE